MYFPENLVSLQNTFWTFWKGMLFFSQPAGVQDFSPTLKTFLSSFFAMQDSFLLNFGFAGIFFGGFWTPPPLFTFVTVHP